MLKQKLFSWLLISFLLTSCDVFRAFKGNREIARFFNKELNLWCPEENIIFKKYNFLIGGEKFDSQILWDELEKSLIPATLSLREEINNTKLSKSELRKIQKIFIKKADILLEGFDLIREGLKKKEDKDSMDMIYKGRSKLKLVSKFNKDIEAEVKKLLEKYFIKAENKEIKKFETTQ